MQFKKSTTIWASGSFLAPLGKRCQCTEPHIILSGWADRNDDSRQNMPTRGSAAYPIRLCSEWSRCVRVEFGR